VPTSPCGHVARNGPRIVGSLSQRERLFFGGANPERLGIDSLFAEISQELKGRPSHFEAVYDPTYGFLKRIRIDGFMFVIDDEKDFEISSFKEFEQPESPENKPAQGTMKQIALTLILALTGCAPRYLLYSEAKYPGLMAKGSFGLIWGDRNCGRTGRQAADPACFCQPRSSHRIQNPSRFIGFRGHLQPSEAELERSRKEFFHEHQGGRSPGGISGFFTGMRKNSARSTSVSRHS
jgi:hypothetical protein